MEMLESAAVHSLHEFVFSVPDIGTAEHFYTAFGLDVRRAGNCLELYSDGHPHRWARVYQAERKRLQWLTWGVYEKDWDAFVKRLEKRGLILANGPEQAQGKQVWFSGPDGIPQSIVVSTKCTPDEKSPRIFPPENSPCGRAPRRSQIRQVRPQRLSHILTFTADVDRTVEFYIDVLGLKLSDRSGAIIAFLHGAHGSDHHLIALAKSSGPGLHHSSWDVTSFDDIGLGSQQMASSGYARGWGVGRHVLGSNYFRYVRDPWGSYCEYSFDIDHISATTNWPAGDYPAEDALYIWGEPPPDDFTRNYEQEAA